MHSESHKLLFYIVLDGFVEAVHLVDKDDGCLGLETVPGLFGPLDRRADVLDAAEHRADGEELRVEGLRHQARDRGLADPGRPPEDAAVRTPRLEGDAQRHAGTQQMLLTDDFAETVRAQLLGQGDMGLVHSFDYPVVGVLQAMQEAPRASLQKILSDLPRPIRIRWGYFIFIKPRWLAA